MTTKTKTKNLNAAYAAMYEVTSTLVMVSTEFVGDWELSVAFVGQNADEQSIRAALTTADVMVGLDYHTSTAIKADGGWKSVKTRTGSWVLVKDTNISFARAVASPVAVLDFEQTMRMNKQFNSVTFLHNGQQIEWSAVKAEILAIEADAAEVF